MCMHLCVRVVFLEEAVLLKNEKRNYSTVKNKSKTKQIL